MHWTDVWSLLFELAAVVVSLLLVLEGLNPDEDVGAVAPLAPEEVVVVCCEPGPAAGGDEPDAELEEAVDCCCWGCCACTWADDDDCEILTDDELSLRICEDELSPPFVNAFGEGAADGVDDDE